MSSSEQQIWDFYNGLLLSPDVDRMRKLLVRYELFKMSMDIPGDVVECGVFKGVGLMYWLKLLQIYAPGTRKKVVGFDLFSSFAESLLPYERATAGTYVAESDYEGADPEALRQVAREMGAEKRLELVVGDMAEAGPKYVEENPGFRISLLHLDLDTYNGTLAALKALYSVVTPGGIIVLDEYGDRGWGESDAVDEFFADRKLQIHAVPYSNKPTAYIVK